MSRESKILYYPSLSVKENAKRNGVSEAAIRYYIKVNDIDRRFDRKQSVIEDCRKYLKNHPNATWNEVQQKTGHSLSTIRKYREFITTEKELTEVKTAEIRDEVTVPIVQKEVEDEILEIRYKVRVNKRSSKYYGLVRCTKDYAYFYQGVPFSNWWTSPAIEYDGHTFSSSESLFMYLKAMQFGDLETAKKIANSKYNQAKKLGKEVKNFNYRVWCSVREDAMYTALEQKLKYDAEFREALLSETYKGKTFVEASRDDTIWGIGAEASDAVLKKGVTAWKGTNLLGKALTRLRDNTLVNGTI